MSGIQASIQSQATIGPPSKRYSDGVSVRADSGPNLRANWDGMTKNLMFNNDSKIKVVLEKLLENEFYFGLSPKSHLVFNTDRKLNFVFR